MTESLRPLATRLAAVEPLLVLPAGLALVLPEVVPSWAPLAALVWIGLVWGLRYVGTGRWTASTVIDAPAIALLLTLPGAVGAVRPDAVAAALGPGASGTDIALSRAYSLLFAIALAYAVANTVRTPATAWLTVGALLAAGLGLGAIGLVSVDWIVKFPALEPVLDRIPRLVGTVPHASLQEPKVHPNALASLLVLFLPLAIACLFWPRGERALEPGNLPPRWVRPLASLALLTLSPLLLLSQSRGAWLALAGSLLVMAALRRHHLFGLVGGMAVAGAFLVFSMGAATFVSAISGGAADASGLNAPSRATLWGQSLALLAEHPFTGIGLNTFPLVHGLKPEYEGLFVYQGFAHAHNTLLQSALDYGLPGFVAVVGLYTALAWAAWRAHRRLFGTPLDAIVIGLAFGLLAHAGHGLFDALAIGGKPGFVPWAFAGALAGVRHYAHRWVERPPSLVESQLSSENSPGAPS